MKFIGNQGGEHHYFTHTPCAIGFMKKPIGRIMLTLEFLHNLKEELMYVMRAIMTSETLHHIYKIYEC